MHPISIPAPARGRTLWLLRCMTTGRYFNSRPREGANLVESAGLSLAGLISIPAPARGRTRLPRRCFRWMIFQFPPPRGGEHPERCTWALRWNFNSRPREGANGPPVRLSWYQRVFQFPPPRGGERNTVWGAADHQNFNSRPREGANSKTAQNRAVYLVSLLKFGRISAILPYILSATRAKKRETPKIIGFLLRRPTGRSCMEQVGAGGVR